MRLNQHIFLFLVLLWTLPGWAQFEDKFWMMGYDFWENDTTFGTTMMDFTEEPVRITYVPEQKMDMQEQFACISDSNGIFLYSNGMQIRNKDYQSISGGDTIGYGPFWQYYALDTNRWLGLSQPQGNIVLPGNQDSSLYYLFYSVSDYLDEYGVLFIGSHLYMSTIRMNRSNDSAIVLFKDEVVVNDTITYGKITACRHANGKDWWILVGERKSNIYYRILFRKGDKFNVDTIKIGSALPNGFGQSGFSLNGEVYYRYEGVNYSDTGAVISIYNFDRCTGRLSAHRTWKVPNYGYCGASISPNSQFLYVTTGLVLLQYDLHAEDVEASVDTVAEYDGYVEPGWFGTYFGMMALAPDGRIYMIPTTGSSRVMHVIDKPNNRGEACNLLQHEIQLPTSNARTLPNFPNYYLEALPDGACDTTTVDSTIVADFLFSIDTTEDPFEVHFTDLSYNEPIAWTWDFGDGSSSNEQHPAHRYNDVGTYSVCLTASNAYRTDSTCKDVVVQDTVSGITTIFRKPEVSISPNPFKGYIDITPSSGMEVMDIVLTDLFGRVLVRVEMSCPCRIRMDAFGPGIYLLSLMEDGRVVKTEKVVKM